MRRSDFLSGLLLGGLLGAAAVLLYTPESGDNMRTRIRGFIDDLRQEVKQASMTRRVELEQELAVLRTPKAEE
ncbi:MAG TPA: YtxH domain-containing protein [Anaerolineaceae bacterium]|jgi:gas vesicle protein|nr:YtxH domain-containing protein [Anaerolineaceae bacterium]